jgi:hypothetical protein
MCRTSPVERKIFTGQGQEYTVRKLGIDGHRDEKRLAKK